ncbi:MauE/DoxX family redox-associated membrane protein [Flavihumibacter solisilvae]|uniref:MauE/DoxX family redox-associated membrane protein n=1 Tax=Flavihumibacter solisilvae TaxID=1349421 RepID=UPI00068D1AE8|nr:MauE/DoxX family redox-associated membrane protein [Flavihumibacter solisilvae]
MSLINRQFLLQLIYGLYIFLWIYAATTKLMEPDKFLGELNQSPLLMPFASFAQILIPSLEYLLVIGLLISRFQYYALYFSFTLMTCFTFYIAAIMHFSPYVPCSCGGILEKMTWGQHLLFNVLFVLLAALGFLQHGNTRSVSNHTTRPNALLQ